MCSKGTRSPVEVMGTGCFGVFCVCVCVCFLTVTTWMSPMCLKFGCDLFKAVSQWQWQRTRPTNSVWMYQYVLSQICLYTVKMTRASSNHTHVTVMKNWLFFGKSFFLKTKWTMLLHLTSLTSLPALVGFFFFSHTFDSMILIHWHTPGQQDKLASIQQNLKSTMWRI